MKTLAIATLLALTPLLAAPAPERSGPSPEHEWLQQLVGEWRAEVEGRGVRETVRAVGEYWIVSETTYTFPAMTAVTTLGYDPEKQSFVGTWVDSTSTYMWTYRGSLDAERTTLTLEAEGPGFDGKPALFRDVIELDAEGRKVHRNFVQGADGTWNPIGVAVTVRAE